MLDLVQAAQDAVFATLKALEGQNGLPAGWGAFQHVPQDREPPFSMIGMIASTNDDSRGEQTELIAVELQHVYRGAGRAPLLDMMHAARAALDNQPLATSEALFEAPRFQRAEVSDALADGVTYVGIQTFEFYAEPA
jgi:hypothetical protein